MSKITIQLKIPGEPGIKPITVSDKRLKPDDIEMAPFKDSEGKEHKGFVSNKDASAIIQARSREAWEASQNLQKIHKTPPPVDTSESGKNPITTVGDLKKSAEPIKPPPSIIPPMPNPFED